MIMGKSKLALAALVVAPLAGGAIWRARAADADYLHWPSTDVKYSSIDGKHIWQNIKEQADIAERYRDSGNPQFWGRLAGTSSDVEDTQWLLNKSAMVGARLGGHGNRRGQDRAAGVGGAVIRQPRHRRRKSRS
jgi:hypothetical protein